MANFVIYVLRLVDDLAISLIVDVIKSFIN